MGFFSSGSKPSKGGTSRPPAQPAPPPPPPPARASQTSASSKGKQPAPVSAVPARSIGIGIETEVHLAGRTSASKAPSMKQFARIFAESHNRLVEKNHPRMHSTVGALYVGVAHNEWSLYHDPTCETSAEPWGLEIISPLFRAHLNSVWRDNVAATWTFIRNNYVVSGDATCSTHVHVSIAEGYTLAEVKRIAQSVIHFEPAFEALVPPERRGNEFARSNWIDNPNFGHKNRSRANAIEMIEKCPTINDVIDLMSPNDSKYFGWNFVSIKKYNTVEFRRGPVSRSVEEVFEWVELASTFIQAALFHGTPSLLQTIPANVGGLHAFLMQAKLPQARGMNDARYLERFFSDKDHKLSTQPKPVGKLTPEKVAMLKKKKALDDKHNAMLEKISHTPQWLH